MAIYHLRVGVGSKQSGQSASAKSNYLARAGKYEKTGDTVMHIESGNMPAWGIAGRGSERAAAYWNAADKHERANGVLFREVEFSLPREMSPEQQLTLAREFAEKTSQGKLPYTLAIHAGYGDNPHCHLMLSERINDGHDRSKDTWFKRAANKNKAPETGGARKADISSNRKKWLMATRQSWANVANQHLEAGGYTDRIDHRTLIEQGITDRKPQPKIGPTINALEKKGIQTNYMTNMIEGMAHECLGTSNREPNGPEPGQDRPAVRTAGPGNGRTDGRNPPNPGVYPESGAIPGERDRPDHAPGREAVARYLPGDPERGPGSQEQRRNGAESEPEPGLANLAYGGDGDCDRFSGSASRICDLAAGIQPGSQGKRRESPSVERLREGLSGLAGSRSKAHSGVDEMAVDRTLAAIRRQIKGFGIEQFEIGIRNGKTGQMMNRTWTPAEIEKNLGWLKRQNSKGEDIYIKPKPSKNGRFVLIDDVEMDDIEQMKNEGFEPALIVETSPNNHQAWIKLPESSQPVRTQAAKILASRYGGDPNSADWNHYGRLAGFTNRKTEHADKVGRSPFVLLRSSKGAEAANGVALVAKAHELAAHNQDVEVGHILRRHEGTQPEPYESPSRLKHWYRGFVEHLKDKFKEAFDFSRADWQASLSLLKKGHETRAIADVVRECSPNLNQRKGVNADDYVTNTVYKAAIWRDLKAKGADWDDVKDQLLTLAKHKLEMERIVDAKEQKVSRKPSQGKGLSL